MDYIFKNAAPCRIYTNYPFSFTEMDNAVFGNYLSNRAFDILHMIVFKTDGEDEDNIYNLFRSFRWAEYRTTPYYVVSAGAKAINTPYPCFFAADSYCILFNPESQRGFFTKNEEVFDCIVKVSEDFMKEATAPASFPKDMLDLKNECCRIFNERIDVTISNNPCISSIINDESIAEVIRSDIPDAESLKRVAAEHYKKLAMNDKQKYVTTDSGLRRFAEKGRIIECPPIMVVNGELPIKYRKRFLELFVGYIESGRAFIIDSKAFKMPEMSIELGENNIQIFLHFQGFSRKNAVIR